MKTAIDTDGTILEFVSGEKSYEGVWFGDKHFDMEGDFWWRPILEQYCNSLKSPEEHKNQHTHSDKVISYDWKMVGGKFTPYFKIDNQTFYLEGQDTEKEAEWFVEMMNIAFMQKLDSTTTSVAPEPIEPEDSLWGEIDMECALLEDVLHGTEGNRITKIRGLIRELKSNIIKSKQ